jgi:hypothetical protein
VRATRRARRDETRAPRRSRTWSTARCGAEFARDGALL